MSHIASDGSCVNNAYDSNVPRSGDKKRDDRDNELAAGKFSINDLGNDSH